MADGRTTTHTVIKVVGMLVVVAVAGLTLLAGLVFGYVYYCFNLAPPTVYKSSTSPSAKYTLEAGYRGMMHNFKCFLLVRQGSHRGRIIAEDVDNVGDIKWSPDSSRVACGEGSSFPVDMAINPWPTYQPWSFCTLTVYDVHRKQIAHRHCDVGLHAPKDCTGVEVDWTWLDNQLIQIRAKYKTAHGRQVHPSIAIYRVRDDGSRLTIEATNPEDGKHPDEEGCKFRSKCPQ